MVKFIHLGLGPQLHVGARIFLIFQDVTGTTISVVGDMPIDSGVLMVTSSNSRICRLHLSEVLIRIGLRVCIHFKSSTPHGCSHFPDFF